jgi:hypothetical protein
VRFVRLVLALVLLLSLSSCGGQALPFGLGRRAAQQQTVPLQIVEGPNNSVLALVPISIHGQGPFVFALDTGAAQSLIDQDIAKQLNLPVVGKGDRITGVTGVENADLVQVDQWRAGDVTLPKTEAISLSLPKPQQGTGLQGLLGSDILSQFGAITVDYDTQVLILRSRRP